MSLPSRLAIATAATIARVGSSSHSLPSLSLAATQCAVAAASIRAARRAAARPTAAASRAATVPGGAASHAQLSAHSARDASAGRMSPLASAAARDAAASAARQSEDAKRDALSGIFGGCGGGGSFVGVTVVGARFGVDMRRTAGYATLVAATLEGQRCAGLGGATTL